MDSRTFVHRVLDTQCETVGGAWKLVLKICGWPSSWGAIYLGELVACRAIKISRF